MLINVLQPIINPLSGQQLEMSPERPMHLADVITDVLLGALPNDPRTGMQKADDYRLSINIIESYKEANKNNDPMVDIGVDQVNRIKGLVAEKYAPMVSGQVWEMLDQGPVEVKQEAG